MHQHEIEHALAEIQKKRSKLEEREIELLREADAFSPFAVDYQYIIKSGGCHLGQTVKIRDTYAVRDPLTKKLDFIGIGSLMTDGIMSFGLIRLTMDKDRNVKVI